MSRSSQAQRSFSSGEVSGLLAGRVDYQRHQTGLALCRGFLPLVEGGITRAPGTRYLGRTRGDAEAVFLSFEFNDDDAVTLELTAGFMRVWRYGALVMDGASPYELATPYDLAALKRLKWAQSADVIYLVDGVLPVRKLSRYALDNWTLDAIEFSGGPLRPWNDDDALTIYASAETGTVTLIASGDVFGAGHVGGLFALKVENWETIPNWTGNTVFAEDELVRYDGRVYSRYGTDGTNSGPNPPVHESGRVLVEKGGITWQFVGTDTGLVRITAVASATEATADVINAISLELITSPGTKIWAPAAWSEIYGHPAAVTIYDDRLIFAATTREPRTLWASAIGGFEDFTTDDAPDMAFAHTIAAKHGVNRIVWLEPGAKGLAIGALGEVQGSRSSSRAEALTAENAAFNMIASIGVNPAQPISPDGFPIFISRNGARVYELKYEFGEDAVKPRDLSLPASHFGAERFQSIAWQSSPLRIGWLTRASGELAVLSYAPGEDVLGWSSCPVAGGAVEAVSVSPAPYGGDDEVIMVVRRTIGGEIRRHIEQLSPFYGVVTGATEISSAEHLYASIVVTPETPQAVFTGLGHLEGKAVLAWTDQGQFGPLTVAGGQVTISQSVGRAVIGMEDDTQRARTLDLYTAARDGDTMGRRQRTRRNGVRLHKTAAYRIRGGQGRWGRPETLHPWQRRSGAEVPGDLREGFSGVDDPNVAIGYDLQNFLEFAPVGAAPMTILALTPITEENG